MSPLSRAVTEAGSTCNAFGLRNWNSDDERTPPPQAVPLPLLRGDNATLHFEPTIFTKNSITGHTMGNAFYPESRKDRWP